MTLLYILYPLFFSRIWSAGLWTSAQRAQCIVHLCTHVCAEYWTGSAVRWTKRKEVRLPSFYPSFCAGRKTSKNVKFTLRSRDCMLREGMLLNKPKNRIDSVPNCTSVYISIHQGYIYILYISKITGTYFSRLFFRNVYMIIVHV